MDPTLGAGSRVVNNGEMRNRGVELSLTTNIIRKKDWNFAVDFNFDYNKNKMLKVDHSESDNARVFIASPQVYFMEGTSYNTLWAYRIHCIENGYPVAVDKDGNDLVKFNEDGTVASITSGSSLKGTDDLVKDSNVLILGFTFKENCPDVRNTKIVDIYHTLEEYTKNITVYDPWANADKVEHEYGVQLTSSSLESLKGKFNAVILAVAHKEFVSLDIRSFLKNENGVVYDVKGILDREMIDGRL